MTSNLSAAAIYKALNNEWSEAITLNEQIISEDPKNIDALNRLAQAYIHLGEIVKARKIYQQVLKLDRLNPIAKRNLDKLKDCNGNGKIHSASSTKTYNFIEEPGKTKVVSLVQIGERPTLSILNACLELEMKIRNQSICLYHDKKYVGRLPDNFGRRLIWLVKRDNRYEFFIKSIDPQKVSVFIRETKCSLKNKNHPSFTAPEKQTRTGAAN